MMRTGFPGYGSAPALAKVRRPAMTAGATRSLAAERRFKRTAGASPGDLRSRSLRSFPKGWKATPATACADAIAHLQLVHPASVDSWIVTRQKSRDNSLGLTFPETGHVCSRPRWLAPITNCRFGADRLARAGAGDARRRNRHHRRSHLCQPGTRRGWTAALRSARQVRGDIRLRLRHCRRSEVVAANGR